MSEAARTPTIFELFASVKKEIGPVGKDSQNEQQHFRFRGIDAVVNAAAPALDKHAVITLPMLQDIEYTTVEVGKNRSLMGHVRVKVTYRFMGPAGDYFDATVPGEAMDSGDKATAKAMSVAYRIALIQALNLPTGDPDPDSQIYERSARGASAGGAFDNAAPASGNGSHPASGSRGRQNSRQQPSGQPKPLAADDPWADRIDEIESAEDVRRVSDEIGRLYHEGKIDAGRARQLRAAARAKGGVPAGPEPGREAAHDQAAPAAAVEYSSFATEFMASLAGLDEGQLAAKRGEIGRAVAERKITPQEASDLSGEVIRRRRTLQEQAEAA